MNPTILFSLYTVEPMDVMRVVVRPIFDGLEANGSRLQWWPGVDRDMDMHFASCPGDMRTSRGKTIRATSPNAHIRSDLVMSLSTL